MSRTKKFISNAISSFFFQIIVMSSGLIIPRLMLETYGSEINGLVSSITQFINYFMIVEAGLAGASIYALYKPLANKDYNAINQIVSATRLFYFKSGYIFVGLVFVCALAYPFFIRTDRLSAIQVGILVLVLGCSGIINFFVMAKYRALVTADQRLYVINYISIVSVFINTLIIFILTRLEVNIVTLRAVALLSVFIPPIVMHYYVQRCYSYLDDKAQPNSRALDKRWDALVLQILGLVHTSTPVILVTFFESLTEVSVFAIYNMVIMGLMQVMSIFGAGLSSSFGELIAQGDTERLRRTYNEYEFMTYSIITLFHSCAWVMLLPFISLYTRGITDADYNRPLVGFLFILNSLLYSIKNPQGTLVTSAGLFRETRCQTLIQALIAVVLGVILAKYLGIAGVLIAFIVSNVYRDIDLIIFIPRMLNNTEIKNTLKRVIISFVEFALISVPFFYYNKEIINYLDWISWGAIVFAYSTIIIVVTSMIFDRNALFASLTRLLGLFGSVRIGRQQG